MAAAAAEAEPAAEEATLSIYKAARRIKRRGSTLYNALRSVAEDAAFVAEIAALWPALPLVANLRCGLWYTHPRSLAATCYFKSTDGHAGNWSFSTARLNLHLALLAGERGGCIIVDSTRKGKRFPDSMSKTIPIWCSVLNRAIQRHRLRASNQVADDLADVDCILNCDSTSRLPSSSSENSYLEIAIVGSKNDRFSLLKNLPKAINFAQRNLIARRKILLCCQTGEDISICVALAIITRLFNDSGCFDDGDYFVKRDITKLEMRKRLVFICKYAINARPSRGNLRQVYGFLCNEKAQLCC
ncbi:hypothetical protein BRADI_1g38000v3 [Brachypodium distachyon]|uniref:Rit1 DUSP-like domain-containing protein n=1 Tax=Brachypodium distachyon TaxID=15368 RepID=A0A2K2DNE8_BRADI|nr:hypothetical protein BRADI_1g38000v3 [Brachypodium distachyon]